MATYNITVLSSSNISGWQLSVNGSIAATNPDLDININDSIVWTFEQGSSHPFRITGNETVWGNYTTGTAIWNPGTNPGIYYYRCTNHGTMVGEITVINPSDPTTTAAPTTTASPTTTAAPTTTTTTTPSPAGGHGHPQTTTPAPYYDPLYFPPNPDETAEGTTATTTTSSPYSSLTASDDTSTSPAHTSDTNTLTGSPFRHSILPTDEEQNPIIKSADITKGAGFGSHYSQGTYPFTGRIKAQDTAFSWSKDEVGGNDAEAFNDDIKDGGDPRSYLRFWFTKNAQGSVVEQRHRSTIVPPFMDMLIWNVNTLDDFGNVFSAFAYRGVSFLRPQFIKRKGAAFTELDGTHQWTRTSNVNKGGDGLRVSPMSNSESQRDLELIGGFTYIHNAGNSTGEGVMQLGGQPVKINIISTPPQRNIYSRYG